MSLYNRLQLKSSCILTVPLHIYDSDFSFIVNGEEFKTTKLISDILSPVICRTHSNDPTFDTFIIDTHYRGNFSHILNLVNFNQINIPQNEVPFITEVIEILETDSIEYSDGNPEITIDNVFTLVKFHEKFNVLYSNQLSAEIDFISSNLFELFESHAKDISDLSIDTLFSIFTSKQIKISNEDQIIQFVNELYSQNSMYSILYETVLFENVTTEVIEQFISIYDINDITKSTWNRLSKRLSKEIEKKKHESDQISIENRYQAPYNEDKIQIFEFSEDKEFDGIINYFNKKTNGQIEKEITITASSVINNDRYRSPRVVTLFEDQSKYFHSDEDEITWICFDFREHRVIPSDYTIRSFPYIHGSYHPKSWVIEGSNDNSSWETIDEETNCSYLNGKNLVHSFSVNQPKNIPFRFIRMRLTGPDWAGKSYFGMNSFEIYGKLL